MKRLIAVLAIAGAVVGIGGVAYAQTGDRAVRRDALRTCRATVKQENPNADKATLKADLKACLQAQGIGGKLTDDQKAQAKTCLQQAKAANPDADKVTVLSAARSCLEQAGIVKPLTADQQARRAKLLACFEQAKQDHPGDRSAIRQAVKACVQAS